MKARKVDMDKIQEFAQMHRKNQETFNRNQNQGSDLPWYDWKTKNLLRLLPPWSDDNLLALPIYSHMSYEPKGKNCQCLRQTWGMQCYVCTAFGRIWKVNRDIKWQWRNRAYTNGIDRYDVDRGVQIVSLPIGVYNWVMIQMAPDPDEIAAGMEPIGDITDPKTGCDLRVLRHSTGPEVYNVKYSSTFISTGTPLHKDPAVAEAFLQATFDLYSIFKKPGSQKIEENIAFARGLLHNAGLDATIGPGQLTDTDKYVVSGAEVAAGPATQSTGSASSTHSASSPVAGKKPECYGSYQDGEDKCLICAFETECMDVKGGSLGSQVDDDIPF